MSEGFDPYHKWLGIPPEEQPPHHYRLLGIKAFESDADVIESAADRQMAHVKTHKTGKHTALSQRLLNELSAAQVCLLNREKKAAYDESLRAALRPPAVAQSALPQFSAPAGPRPVPAVRPQKAAVRNPLLYLSIATGALLLILGVWYAVGKKEMPVVEPVAATAQPGSPAPASVPAVALAEPTSSVEPDKKPQPEPAPPAAPSAERPSWTQGAVLALAFDDSTFFDQDGQRLARDLSGEGNDGVVRQATRVPGKVGQALEFATVKQFVEVPNAASLNPTRGLTLAAWIKADAWRGGLLEGVIVSKSNLKAYAGYILRGGDGGRIDVALLGPKEWLSTVSEARVQPDQWRHVAAAFADDRVRLFIDGELQLEQPFSGPIKPSPLPVRVGAGAKERHFEGAIDEVAIWNRGLSTEEVQHIYEFSRNGKSYCLAIGGVSGIPPTDGAPQTAEVAAAEESPLPPLADVLPKRMPKPAEDALKAAEAAIEQTYRTELTAAAKEPGIKRAVALKLYNTAVETQNDPAAMFAMLERSAALATQGGDYEVARDALDALGQQFNIDALALKETALASAARLAKPGDFLRVAQSWKGLADEALASDRYDEAKRFLQQAATSARKTTDKPLVAMLVETGKTIETIQAEYASAAEAQAALQKSPQDVAAAAKWGRFLCRYKNDWDAGLPLWALDSADPLVEVARQDLNQPDSPPEQMRLADAWWQAAAAEQEPLPQKWIKARAALWYRKAQPALSGIDLDQARKRIDESEQDVSQFPQEEWVSVLGMVDPAKHKVVGEWVRQGAEIAIIKAVDLTRLMVPVAIDGSYDLELRYTLRSGHETDILIPVGDRQILVVVGGTKSNGIGGLSRIDGQGSDTNPSTVKHPKLAAGKYKLDIRVELIGDQAKIEVDLNSRRYLRWQGSRSSVSLDPRRRVPNSSAIGLGNHQTTAVYHSVRLRLHSGTAQPLYE